jgi:predicted HAD superfamily Cof-like phosphohydrolase
MDKIDALNQVAEFHKTFKHPILSEPAIPSEKRCNLRVELIAEELKELQEAIKDKDMIEIADALCDIQYVLSGAVLEFGLGDKFRELFDEVQRSNMSKTCKTVEEAGDVYLVYRKSDNKTLKSVKYSPADLKGILEKQPVG